MARKTEERTVRLVVLEKETLERVIKSIAKIEGAVDAWKTSKEKPALLKRKVEHLGKAHALLSSWAKRSIGGSREPNEVYARLAEFTQICREIDYQKE